MNLSSRCFILSLVIFMLTGCIYQFELGAPLPLDMCSPLPIPDKCRLVSPEENGDTPPKKVTRIENSMEYVMEDPENSNDIKFRAIDAGHGVYLAQLEEQGKDADPEIIHMLVKFQDDRLYVMQDNHSEELRQLLLKAGMTGDETILRKETFAADIITVPSKSREELSAFVEALRKITQDIVFDPLADGKDTFLRIEAAQWSAIRGTSF